MNNVARVIEYANRYILTVWLIDSDDDLYRWRIAYAGNGESCIVAGSLYALSFDEALEAGRDALKKIAMEAVR